MPRHSPPSPIDTTVATVPVSSTLAESSLPSSLSSSSASSMCSHAPRQPEQHTRRWQYHPCPESATFSARTGHTVVSYQDSIYLFGGTDQHRRQNDLYEYKVGGNSWTKVRTRGGIPSRRSGAVGCVVKDKMYLFGGYDGRDGNYFNDLFEYEFATHTWREIRPRRSLLREDGSFHQSVLEANQGMRIPPPRTDHALVHYNNSLYVFGGYDGTTRFQDVFAFDLASRVWRVEAENEPLKPSRRFGHSGIVHDNSFWMFGGWDGRDTLDCTWRYDFKDRKWQDIQMIQSPQSRTWRRSESDRPRHRYRHSAVVLGDSMYLFGGVDKDHVRFNDLHRFVFRTCEWEEVKVTGILPSSRTFHRSVVVGESMYLLGGYDGKRRLNDIRSVYLGNLTPAPLRSLCAQYIRCNLWQVRDMGIVSNQVAAHMADLIWTRDADGILRGGIEEATGHVTCTGFERTVLFAPGSEDIAHRLADLSPRGDAISTTPASIARQTASSMTTAPVRMRAMAMVMAQARSSATASSNNGDNGSTSADAAAAAAVTRPHKTSLLHRCAACGYAASLHDAIDEQAVFRTALWQPDCERATSADRAQQGEQEQDNHDDEEEEEEIEVVDSDDICVAEGPLTTHSSSSSKGKARDFKIRMTKVPKLSMKQHQSHRTHRADSDGSVSALASPSKKARMSTRNSAGGASGSDSGGGSASSMGLSAAQSLSCAAASAASASSCSVASASASLSSLSSSFSSSLTSSMRGAVRVPGWTSRKLRRVPKYRSNSLQSADSSTDMERNIDDGGNADATVAQMSSSGPVEGAAASCSDRPSR